MNKSTLMIWVIFTFTLALLGGCSQKLQHGAATEPALSDIHERLSYIIRRQGFRHGIMSTRDDERDIDTIFVSVPLDGLKRKHPGLEKMLTMVGNICALPEYTDIAVRIELGTMDESDINFMRDIFKKTLGNKPNAEVVSVKDSRSDITITVTHEPFKKSR